MLTLPKKGVGSLSLFPLQKPRTQTPGRVLPPQQPILTKVNTRRGPHNHGHVNKAWQRGRPFTIWWSSLYGCPMATLGKTGTYQLHWMTIEQMLEVLASGDQLKKYEYFYCWFFYHHAPNPR